MLSNSKKMLGFITVSLGALRRHLVRYARLRWATLLICSVFVLKAMNSQIIDVDWWHERVCLHPHFDGWCYERFWYFTFSYRRWEMIVPAILLVASGWRCRPKRWAVIILLTFYCYEFAEYWLINNKVDKTIVSMAMVVLIFITVWMDRKTNDSNYDN